MEKTQLIGHTNSTTSIKNSYIKMKKIYLLPLLLLLYLSYGCKEDKKRNTKAELSTDFQAPAFSADNAYALIEKQLAFGPRVPGTDTHKACKDFLESTLKATGATVNVQEFSADFLTVKGATAYNIIGTFNPNAPRRIMLAAHWDSRLIAEKDADPAKKNIPIAGADDGASGVAVLLELAQIIQKNPLQTIGIDMVLFDAEDQGDSNGATETWCLGSQYWGQNPHTSNYFAEYGVLLDMVGAKDAHFGLEEISTANAKTQQTKIWSLAKTLGYEDLFTQVNTGTIVDDHYFVMKYRGFPMVDIINRPLKLQHGFGHYHHTHEDNIDIISKETLAKVGHVITQLIYREEKDQI